LNRTLRTGAVSPLGLNSFGVMTMRGVGMGQP
jgi:hypothetical protein